MLRSMVKCKGFFTNIFSQIVLIYNSDTTFLRGQCVPLVTQMFVIMLIKAKINLYNPLKMLNNLIKV